MLLFIPFTILLPNINSLLTLTYSWLIPTCYNLIRKGITPRRSLLLVQKLYSPPFPCLSRFAFLFITFIS